MNVVLAGLVFVVVFCGLEQILGACPRGWLGAIHLGVHLDRAGVLVKVIGLEVIRPRTEAASGSGSGSSSM